MEPVEIEQLEETAGLDVRRFKRLLEERDDAMREFRRVKTALLARACEPRRPLPRRSTGPAMDER